MSLLVTGATGRLGRLLTARLQAAGREVRILARDVDAADSIVKGAFVCRGDLLEASTLPGAVEGVTEVVHLAAVTRSYHKRSYYDVNVQGTRNLLAALRGQRLEIFLHMSTRALGAEGGAYAHSKLLAEEAVLDAKVPAVILRPAEVCGTASGDPLLALARAVRKWPVVPMVGDGRYRLAPIHAEDVIRCVFKALDSPGLIGRAYTLAGEEVAFSDLVDIIAFRFGVTPLKARVPVSAAKAVTWAGGLLGIGPAPDQVDRLLVEKSADSSRAREDLSFSPSKIDDLLERVLEGAGAGKPVI